MSRATFHIALFALVMSLGSCTGQRMMLTSEKGELVQLLSVDTGYEHHIRPDDKISLSVWDHDDLSLGSVYNIYNAHESFGKWVLVDKQGYAELPRLGKIHLAGLTCRQASDTLELLYGHEIAHPILVVKVLNRTVNVFGEVTKPGAYVLEKERTTITEIIGRTEGFTSYANVKSIRLIRNDISYTINLKHLDESFLHHIIVQADDIIIVPAKKGKVLDQKAPTLIPFSSALTAIVLVATLLL
jgi:polysaccharide export outer membrane protein